MYYVYQNGVHVKALNTEAEGTAWVLRQIAAWRTAGALGHPEYKLCYNGTNSVCLVTWKQTTFKDHDARAAQFANP